MTKKKKNSNDIKIHFIGQNAIEVTGSCILIETENKKILLECGLYQSNDIKGDYKINSKKFDFNPAEIDYVFILHAHIDHTGLLGRLIKEGFNGRIITTSITAKIMDVLLRDSAFIIKRDSEYLTKHMKKYVEPLYEENHIDGVLNRTYEYDFDNIYNLDDKISFKLIHNCHIIGAAQLELYIKNSLDIQKTILYTSDIGSQKIKKDFVSDNEYCEKANIAIVESTYGNSDRIISKKNRDKDIEKLKSSIETVCLDRKGRILIPCFSLDRSQYMLKLIYDLFHNDPDFNIPIIVDSPLTCKITEVYRQVLSDEDKKIFEDVINWDNVFFISNHEESKLMQLDPNPKVVISSSGFLVCGRSVAYLKQFISKSKDMILFVGYSSDNSLATKIKNGQEEKEISISGIKYSNKCDIMDLKSFSSHIQRDEMIEYYSNINCDSIYLVHGDMNSKNSLKQDLEEELKKKNKTTKVIVTNKKTIAKL